MYLVRSQFSRSVCKNTRVSSILCFTLFLMPRTRPLNFFFAYCMLNALFIPIEKKEARI